MIRKTSKIAAFISTVLIIVCCGNKQNISNTSWTLIDDNNNRSIHFFDSTCIITEKLLNSIDTMYAAYSFNKDTIIFKPVKEYVFINSQLYRKGDTLYESKKHIPVCVLKNK